MYYFCLSGLLIYYEIVLSVLFIALFTLSCPMRLVLIYLFLLVYLSSSSLLCINETYFQPDDLVTASVPLVC